MRHLDSLRPYFKGEESIRAVESEQLSLGIFPVCINVQTRAGGVGW
jgi:hypothetical protein